MSANSKIEWCDRTWNPLLGCERVSDGCDNCLSSETRVLRADMTWVPIADIKVGDRVVSFTDQPAIGQNRLWEEATVLATWETEKPTVTFTLENGTTITASEDHRWLIGQRGHENWWRTTLALTFKTSVRTVRCEPTNTDSLDYRAGYVAGATAGDGTFRWADAQPGQQVYWRIAKPERDRVVLERIAAFLASLGVPMHVQPFDAGSNGFTSNPLPMAKVETRKAANLEAIAAMCEERDTREWMAGWLAGMFDTDASYTGGNLRFCQSKANDVLDRVVRYGKELEFDLRREDWVNNCPTVRLAGGIAENIAFLSAISPVMPHRLRDFYGKRVDTVDLRVTGISRGPVRKLIDITTSTGTFIAEGALTHNCYAISTATIRAANPNPKVASAFAGLTARNDAGRIDWTGRINLLPDRLTQPLRWRKRSKVFVNSQADLFHKDVPDDFIAQVFAVMALSPIHTFQLLTKRHARMRSLLSSPAFHRLVASAAPNYGGNDPDLAQDYVTSTWPLPNVWVGVSVEDQHWANIRIPALLDTPAAVRWLSCEPLLGPLSLRTGRYAMPPDGEFFGTSLDGIDWCVVGGESGPGARLMQPEWATFIRDQCASAGVPFFFKQTGSVLAKQMGLTGKGDDWDEWPEEWRVREYPKSPAADVAVV